MSHHSNHNMPPCGRPPQHPLIFGELNYTAEQINALLGMIPFKADRAEVPKMEKLSDVNYLGHVADATLLPEQEQPAWALVGNIEAARPYFYYVEDFVPKGYQQGWNDISQDLGTYDLTALNEVYHTKLLSRFGSYEQIDGAAVTEQDIQEIARIIKAVQNNKTVSFFYEPDEVTFNYFGTLDCYYNSSKTEFGCYLPTSDGYVIARCNISKPDKWALVLSSCDNEVSNSKNYNSLKGRPAINGVTLSGNHKPSELDLATLTEFNTLKKDVAEVSSDAQQKAEYAVETSDEARNISVSAESKSDFAVATSNEAKRTSEIARNAVTTLEGLANATTAAQTLADQVVQIEENKQNISELGSLLGTKIIPFDTDAETTRKSIPFMDRKGGLCVVYYNGNEIILEQRIRNDGFVDDVWGRDEYWKRISYKNDVDNLNNNISLLLGTDFLDKASTIEYNDGWIDELGSVTINTSWKYSNPIEVKQGDIIIVNTTGISSASRIAISKVENDNDVIKYSPILKFNDAYSSYVWVANKDMAIAVSYRDVVSPKPKVYWLHSDTVGGLYRDIINTIEITTNKVDDKYKHHIIASENVILDIEKQGEGYVNNNGGITSSTAYAYSKPIAFESGDLIYFTCKGTASVALLSQSDKDGNIHIPLIYGDGTLNEFSYYVKDACYLAFCWKPEDGGIVVTKSNSGIIRQMQLQENRFNPRLRNNGLVKSLAHQGISTSVGSGNNRLSAFWGSYLEGCDVNLVNISWSSDNEPIASHDPTFKDAISGETISISAHTLSDLQSNYQISKYTNEPIASIDDVVYLSKMLGQQVWFVNASGLTSAQMQKLKDIVATYQMKDDVYWMTDENGANNILSWHNSSNIALCQDNITQTNPVDVETILSIAKTIVTEKCKVILWINSNHDVTNIINWNKQLPENIEIGCFNVADDRMAEILPYVKVYSSHYHSSGSAIGNIFNKIAEKYPFILNGYKGFVLPPFM